jgi:hypothetical protein
MRVLRQYIILSMGSRLRGNDGSEYDGSKYDGIKYDGIKYDGIEYDVQLDQRGEPPRRLVLPDPTTVLLTFGSP